MGLNQAIRLQKTTKDTPLLELSDTSRHNPLYVHSKHAKIMQYNKTPSFCPCPCWNEASESSLKWHPGIGEMWVYVEEWVFRNRRWFVSIHPSAPFTYISMRVSWNGLQYVQRPANINVQRFPCQTNKDIQLLQKGQEGRERNLRST